ncbi:MAG TPA: hypothetical protein ENK08_04240 [Chloroflexi bacterium]|nr:hypothetical protein [Chloroflexota bacterium]
MSVVGQVVEHLEYLGYEVEQDGEVYRARHTSKWDLVVRDYKGGVLIVTWLGTNEYAKQERLEYLEFINGLNGKAAVARFYADEDMDLVMEAFFGGEYDRVRFGEFMESWDEDTGMKLVLSGAEKYLQ